MKEININIEGYNVNGICVGCLNYNRNMFYSNEIQDCFKNLAGIDVPDGLSIQVCWECLAAVRATNRFREQILQSYHTLIEYSRKHTFLNSPTDLSKYAQQRLKSSTVDTFSTVVKVPPPVDTIEVEIKTEFEDEIKFEVPLLEDAKVEDNQYPQDTLDTLSDDFHQDPQPDVESEDDLQLSLLKEIKKKGKRGRKSKREKKEDGSRGRSKSKTIEVKDEARGSRKLKNLPENIVQLHFMTEEEMWQVRSEDRACKEFIKLKYKCDDCIIGFNTEKLMSDHLNGKHQPKSATCQQCDVCKAYFLTKDNLSTHRSLHLNAFKCIQCNYISSMKRLMLRHAQTHGDTVLQCDMCEAQLSSKSKLAYHKSVCHQEKPQCDCCGKVFANKMTLKYHLKILPQNKENKHKEKLYIPCKGCNKVFHSKKSYRAHVVIHDGLTYPCPICGKLFQWKRNLARHTRNHRERDAGALHECRQCGKTFSSRDCYNNHMRLSKRHVPEHALGHECNYCGKKFATKWCMVDHIDWDHLKRIKYQCSVCFKPFKTAKIMVAHMNNIHGGKKREVEGQHLCEICGKSYKTSKRLKGHVWAMHTNRSTTKSFKCKLCPATFTWQTSIYKHTKMMHSAGKRNKQPPRPPPPKKEPPYMELDGRMQYFTHLTGEMGPPHVVGIVQNLV
ncbi:zinc finger protein 57-like [Pectinophora gossypiella]|uniref:zinc finger protein 57-like n=1 Tax=Pectinophora gossypiella TaxID=13191 RepID=UPI00214F1ABF|nr:zinc finger protein 57-like [Pectinophora gossypiella]